MNFTRINDGHVCKCLRNCVENYEDLFLRRIDNKNKLHIRDFRTHHERNKTSEGGCDNLCGNRGLSIEIFNEESLAATINQIQVTRQFNPQSSRKHVAIFRLREGAGIVKHTPNQIVYNKNHYDLFKSDEFSLDFEPWTSLFLLKMFEIDEKYKQEKESDIFTIADNYQVFHFDEFPILFSGTNIYGNRILGSLISEDEDGYLFHYMHFLVTDKEYVLFTKGVSTYRDLLLKKQLIYIVEKTINGELNQNFIIDVNLIPAEYLPLEKSFCPNVQSVLGLNYSFSLQGKLADVYSAIPKVAASITTSIESIFLNLLKPLNIPSIDPKLLLTVPSEGSFKINFRITVDRKGQLPLFFGNQDESIQEYVQNFIEYLLNDFTSETELLLEREANLNKVDFEDLGIDKESKYSKKITSKLANVYQSIGLPYSKSAEQKTMSSILKSVDHLDKIGEEIGKGFIQIEVLGHDNNDKDISIGLINADFAEEIVEQIQYIEEYGKVVEIDDEYQQYNLQIYDLNTDTRKGTAHIKNKYVDDIWDKPKIKIIGDSNLIKSTFTESLHLNKFITVSAKAKSVNGKFTYMDILFER
ncbi:hypothetical protein [Dyadobacter sp. Leaf189]|uniref:hypothetical protein n=1 Tax=Dyadobacter sp. Leaf189 TaxID=1736295 RepID=UPI0012F9C1CF|nr:hypothetical protein [Dyadobacter sp. Leaf189]